MSRCIDAVAIRNGLYRSIEYKLHHWQQAVKQAKDHKRSFDKSYICMPKPGYVAFHSVAEKCKESGIGLIICYDNKFKLIIPAKRNDIWELNRKSMIEIVNKIRRGDVKKSKS